MENKATILPATLNTDHLCLRQFSLEDTSSLLTILNEPGILDYFPPTSPPDEARVERLINRQLTHWTEHGYGWWAVTLPDTGSLAGWCGLQYLPETAETEVGYLLSHAEWGKGYASESALASVNAGFTDLNLDKIIGLTHLENIASQRVLEKAGLTYLGDFEYFEIVCKKFELLRSDWRV